jgi:hypothetical protein
MLLPHHTVVNTGKGFWEVFFQLVCDRNLMSYSQLSRCTSVSRVWKDAVRHQYHLLRILSFHDGSSNSDTGKRKVVNLIGKRSALQGCMRVDDRGRRAICGLDKEDGKYFDETDKALGSIREARQRMRNSYDGDQDAYDSTEDECESDDDAYESDEDSSEVDEETSLEDEERESKAVTTGASAPILPPWQVARDPATGKSYFYNITTGVVQWEPPGITEIQMPVQPEFAAFAAMMQSIMLQMPHVNPPAPPPTPGLLLLARNEEARLLASCTRRQEELFSTRQSVSGQAS